MRKIADMTIERESEYKRSYTIEVYDMDEDYLWVAIHSTSTKQIVGHLTFQKGYNIIQFFNDIESRMFGGSFVVDETFDMRKVNKRTKKRPVSFLEFIRSNPPKDTKKSSQKQNKRTSRRSNASSGTKKSKSTTKSKRTVSNVTKKKSTSKRKPTNKKTTTRRRRKNNKNDKGNSQKRKPLL